MHTKTLGPLFLVVNLMTSPPVQAEQQTPVRTLLEQREQGVILQNFDLSCGAAALATLLNFQHGEKLTERQVAIGLISRDIYLANPQLLRTRQGFSLLDMQRFSGELGYRGEAMGQLTINDLIEQSPAIVPVNLYGFSHFVVFRGVLAGNVVLADPAFGNRTLSLQRFLTAWIEYDELGQVAFAVKRRDGLIPPDQLQVSAADLPILLPQDYDPER